MRRPTRAPASPCSGTPATTTRRSRSALLTDGGPDIFEFGNGPSIDMIQGGQVVDMSGILGGAESDFTRSLVQRMTYEGKLYAVPQVTDMQLLVYRKSLLQAAGVNPPATVDELIAAAKKLTTDKVKGLFAGNDGGIGVLGGPMLWAAGQDYLSDDQTQMGFDDNRGAAALGRLRNLFTSNALLLGAPADWSDPSAFTQGLCAMQWTGLWTLPDDPEGVRRGLRRHGVAGARRRRRQAVGAGRRIRRPASAPRPRNVDAAKGFVKWLWIDQTAKPARLRAVATASTSRPGRASRPRRDKLKTGARRRRGQARQRDRPRADTAAVDAEVRDGVLRRDDPHRQGRRRPEGRDRHGKTTIDAELKRVNG